jgi:hypothetical protein
MNNLNNKQNSLLVKSIYITYIVGAIIISVIIHIKYNTYDIKQFNTFRFIGGFLTIFGLYSIITTIKHIKQNNEYAKKATLYLIGYNTATLILGLYWMIILGKISHIHFIFSSTGLY